MKNWRVGGDINADGWVDIYVSAPFLKDPRVLNYTLLYIKRETIKQGILTFL